MKEQWQELKETIIEMRDNDGTGTQQEACKFLANYMDILEKQMQEPCDKCEVGNPCIYCKHEFEPQERSEEFSQGLVKISQGFSQGK